MTDRGSAAPEPPDDHDNRNVKNAAMVGVIVVLVVAGTWLFSAMIDIRKAQGCARPGTPQLYNDRGPRSGAIAKWEKRDAKVAVDKVDRSRGATDPDWRSSRDGAEREQ